MSHEELDQFASLYGNENNVRSRMDTLIERYIFDRIKPDIKGPDILEMGFGDGVFTKEIIREFGKSSIVDASTELLLKAEKEHGGLVKTYNSYFEKFSPSERFDTIFCTYVLEHVDDPVQCLQRSKEWLKPSVGRVLIMVPNALSYHRELGVAMNLFCSVTELGDTDKEIGHKRVYTPEHLENDIKMAGLKIEKNCNFFFKPFNYAILQHCSESQITGLFKMDKLIPNERRAALYYVCS